jgi:hypothetical protein
LIDAAFAAKQKKDRLVAVGCKHISGNCLSLRHQDQSEVREADVLSAVVPALHRLRQNARGVNMRAVCVPKPPATPEKPDRVRTPGFITIPDQNNPHHGKFQCIIEDFGQSTMSLFQACSNFLDPFRK